MTATPTPVQPVRSSAPPTWLAVALGAGLLVYLWGITTGFSGSVKVGGDALVYRAGSRAWLDGLTVYGEKLPLELGAGNMYFTYSPLALVALAPLTVLPVDASMLLLATLSLGALWLTAALWWRVLRPGTQSTLVASLAITLASALLEPVHGHLRIGQVNLFLVALVSADLLLVRTWWPRGLLSGIAVVLKITPAAALLEPLLARRLRLLLVTGVTALIGVLVGWLVVPDEARFYWTTALRDPGRVGNLRRMENQSLRALFERFVDGPLGGALWLLACALVVGMLVVLVRHHLRIGDRAGALALSFTGPVLLSPVAWVHHWVWVLPLLWWLTVRACEGRRVVEGMLAASGVLVLGLFQFYDLDPVTLAPSDQQWSALAAAAAGGYVYWCCAVLIVLLVRRSDRE